RRYEIRYCGVSRGGDCAVLDAFPTRRSSDLVDGVAQPGVLHVHDRGLAAAEIVAGREGNGVALVGGDHVILGGRVIGDVGAEIRDRKSTRLNSSHVKISYAVFCLNKKTGTGR